MQKIIISASLLVSLLFGVQMGFAQNITDGDPSNDVCVNLQTSVFRYKSSDMTTNGEVSDLQDFLIAKGMLSGTPTGFYGRLTVAAVKTYQRSLGVSPTGNVGSLTKSLIQKETCTGESQPITDPVVISPIPGMKTITYYYINDAHTACGRGTLITNIGLVNGEYVYKPGQYKTESECKTTNGLPSIPTGIMCTMEVKLCPDGSAMQRDPNCSWRSDKCAVSTIYSRPSITNVVTSLSGDILTATIYGYNLEKVNNVSEERKVDGTRYITPSSVDYGKVTVVLSTRGAYNGISTFKVYSQNGAVESNMMSITLPEVSSIIPKVSSVTLENNTANDGSKILRVNGSNLDYTGTVVVNGCSFYSEKGGSSQIPFYVESSQVRCFLEGQLVSGYLVWGKDSTIVQDSNFNFIVPITGSVGLNLKLLDSMDEVRFDGSTDNQATFTYDISGYNKNYVLQVEPELVSSGVINFSSYRITMSSAAGLTYSNAEINPYSKGGASYRFDGKNGRVTVTRNTNDNVGLKLMLKVVDTTTGQEKNATSITVTAKG